MAEKTKRIIALTTIRGSTLTMNHGETAEVPASIAKGLIDAGAAQEVSPPTTPTTPTTPTPSPATTESEPEAKSESEPELEQRGGSKAQAKSGSGAGTDKGK